MRHHHLAIWVTVILHLVLGFVWYSPYTFLEPWAYGFALDLETMSAPNPLAFIFVIAGAAASCYVISWLIRRLTITGLGGAIWLGVLLWLGLGFPALAPHYVFGQVGNSALIIDLASTFVATLMTCIILTLWRKPHRTIA